MGNVQSLTTDLTTTIFWIYLLLFCSNLLTPLVSLLRMFYRDLRAFDRDCCNFCCLLVVNQPEIFAVCSHRDWELLNKYSGPLSFSHWQSQRQSLTNPLKSPYGWIFIYFLALVLLCTAECCNITNKLWLSLYSSAFSIPGLPGWLWVGGDWWDQTRYLTALTSSRSLIPSAPRSSNNSSLA